MIRCRGGNRAGFTLVELLVVIAIIGLLVALLLSAVQSARESARRSHCANNLRQLGVAAQLFHNQYEHFPGSWVNGDENISCGLGLLPFLEEHGLANAWDKSANWWEGDNARLVATPIAVYKCPTSPSPAVYFFSEPGRPEEYATFDYKGCDGASALDPAVAHWGMSTWILGVVSRKYVAASEIVDGLSTTILLVESVGGRTLYGPGGGPMSPSEIWYPHDGAWVGRAMSGVSPIKYGERMKLARCGVNCSNMYDYGPYSFHPGLAQVVMCDGGVRPVMEDIDDAVLCGLYTYRDGQLIGSF